MTARPAAAPVTIPYDMPDVPARDLIPRGRPTFAQNIRGHAFNTLTMTLGEDERMPLSRRLEIANAIGDAILAFLAPLGLDDEPAAGGGQADPGRLAP